MLRSEKVQKISLYFGGENVRDAMARMGESGLVHLVDANPITKSEQRLCSEELKNVERLEQRMSYFRNEIEIPNGIEDWDRNTTFGDVSCDIDKYYMMLVELRKIQREQLRMKQHSEADHVMATVSKKYLDSVAPPDSFPVDFDFVIGLVERQQKFLVKKTLKRRLRRNVFLKMIDVELKCMPKQQTAMLVYVLGDDAKKRAREILLSVGGIAFDENVYREAKRRALCPSSGQDSPSDERAAAIDVLYSDYKDAGELARSSKRQIDAFLKKASTKYVTWKYFVNRERQILEALNKLSNETEAECFLGEGWVLEEDLTKLHKLKSPEGHKGRFVFEPVKAAGTPPSYFKTSEITEAFQGFTNVFGIPKYREVNPALFMIFTFPFMFGAMFGDILHGLLLTAISTFMIRNFEKYNHKCGVFQIILEGRYVMLLCSFAAIWFGLLYGDFGSMPVAFFKSQFEAGRTYPFGIDPAWHHADNRTVFINSVKMKLSLILGYVHMSLGSFISLRNALYFKDKLTLMCVAIPQFIIFNLFLGYLVFLCIYKWLVTSNYPSLVNTLIGMYTSPFTIAEPMYPGQKFVQLFILSTILVCVPWMLFGKPAYLVLRRRIPKEGMLDLWITSGIHVVEFGLGLISNTSSYLRLWAVSLAHVQLTSVLHQFTIGNSNWIAAVCLSPVYLVCTLLLLIGLEGLSACLHALRLNWIEFFSKFYSGGGLEFSPVSFKLRYEDVFEA